MRSLLEQQQLTLKDGTFIHYYTAGRQDGPSLVLLHGGGTDHALLSWADTVPALLAHGYRIYLPDMPGYGSSPLPAWPVTLPNLTACLTEWAEQIGLKQAAYCGLSMGGAVALAYALAHPERVNKLVLIGSYGLQTKVLMHQLAYLLVRLPFMDGLNTWLARSPNMLKRTLKPLIQNPASLTDELMRDVAQAAANKDSQVAWNQFQRHEIGWNGLASNFVPRLPELRPPTLLIHGSLDTAVLVQNARRAAKLIPKATLHIVAGAGHWTQRDRPDEVNHALLRFLGGE